MADIPFELDEEGAAVLQPLITARGHGSLVELLNEALALLRRVHREEQAGRVIAAVDPQTGTGTPYPTFTFTPTAPPAPTDDLTPPAPQPRASDLDRAKALLAAAKAQLAEQPRHGGDTPAS